LGVAPRRQSEDEKTALLLPSLVKQALGRSVEPESFGRYSSLSVAAVWKSAQIYRACVAAAARRTSSLDGSSSRSRCLSSTRCAAHDGRHNFPLERGKYLGRLFIEDNPPSTRDSISSHPL